MPAALFGGSFLDMNYSNCCFQAGEVPAALHPPFPEPSVRCGNCRSMVSQARTRLINKSQGRYRCLTCCCRVVQLTRGFGTWPTKEFREMSTTAQEALFKDLLNIESGIEITSRATQVMRHREEHSRFYAENGEFLPLSVWARGVPGGPHSGPHAAHRHHGAPCPWHGVPRRADVHRPEGRGYLELGDEDRAHDLGGRAKAADSASPGTSVAKLQRERQRAHEEAQDAD